jgi:hypothetical protein
MYYVAKGAGTKLQRDTISFNVYYAPIKQPALLLEKGFEKLCQT